MQWKFIILTKKNINFTFFRNIISKHNKNEIKQIIDSRVKTKEKILSFLSIGVDWEEKGMNDAISFVKKLNELNIKSEINIVGCLPKSNDIYNEKFIKI